MPGKDPWLVASYEVDMHEKLPVDPQSLDLVQNALTESRVLHARQLCEIFLDLGGDVDNVRLEHLVSDWPNRSECQHLIELRDELKRLYGRRDETDTPRWIFNKMMAHPTLERTDHYDYGKALERIAPTLRRMVDEIEAITGRTFRRLL